MPTSGMQMVHTSTRPCGDKLGAGYGAARIQLHVHLSRDLAAQCFCNVDVGGLLLQVFCVHSMRRTSITAITCLWRDGPMVAAAMSLAALSVLLVARKYAAGTDAWPCAGVKAM